MEQKTQWSVLCRPTAWWVFRSIYHLGGTLYGQSMQTNLRQIVRDPNLSFASAWLVFWSFGSLHPNHTNTTSPPHHLNQMKPRQAQPSDADSWYTTPRSPGFNG